MMVTDDAIDLDLCFSLTLYCLVFKSAHLCVCVYIYIYIYIYIKNKTFIIRSYMSVSFEGLEETEI